MTPRRFLAAVSVGMALSACAASPPTRFFTLDAVPAASPPATATRLAQVQVLAVHLPPGLDRPELVRRSGPDEIAVNDFARWSAPLGETAQRALTQDLTARMPVGAVLYPAIPQPASARGLVVDVLAVDAGGGGQAVMDVSWTLARRPGDPEPVGRPRIYRLATASTGISAQAAAADLSALLGMLADRIAADLAANAP